jgi:hypothetical protein
VELKVWITNVTFEAELCVVLKLGHFGKQIINTSKVFKCGAGEG